MKDALDVLFARLLWASGFARESAFVEIAKLISTGNATITNRLILWISEQEVESIAAHGIVPFLYARLSLGYSKHPDIQTWRELKFKKSALSDFYIGLLYEQDYSAQTEYDITGDNIAVEAQSEVEFHRYDKSLLPPYITRKVKSISRVTSVDIYQRWIYEWQILAKRLPHLKTQDVLSYRGNNDREHMLTFFCNQTELYRSSLLKAISWAIVKQNIGNEFVKVLGALLNPVNFGFTDWMPIKKPSYIPEAKKEDALVDSDTGQIVTALTQYFANVLTSRDEWLPLYSSGQVARTDKVVYDFIVHGIFHRTVGSAVPSSEDLFEWLNDEPYMLYHAQPLKMDSVDRDLIFPAFDESIERFGDWEVYPATRLFYYNGIVPNKSWLHVKGIRVVDPYVAGNAVKIVARPESITTEANGEVVARWSYWTDALSEQAYSTLNASLGWECIADKERIVAFMNDNHASLCFVCCIVLNVRNDSYGEYNQTQYVFTIGGSRIIK